MVLNWGQFCHPGDIWQCLNSFGCHNWHLVDRGWNAMEHPTMPRTVPKTKDYAAQNASSTEVEKLCSNGFSTAWHTSKIYCHLEPIPLTQRLFSAVSEDLQLN